MNAVDIIAPTLNDCDAWGQMAWELHAWFEASGQPVHLHAPGEVLVNAAEQTTQAGTVALGYPTNWRGIRGGDLARPLVAVSMFESTRLPPTWIEALNEADAVVVPTQWSADVYRDSGVTVPITVEPLGVREDFAFIRRLQGRSPFTFLTVADRQFIKGWRETVRVFRATFGESRQYRLIIKTRVNGIRVVVDAPNIQVVNEDMTVTQLRGLFGAADCFIAASYGEGFGLWPREAAATGLPVIATEWSGLTHNLHGWGYPLRYTLVEAWQDHEAPEGAGGVWAAPDEAHLSELMQYVASGSTVARGMAFQASRRVAGWYSWQRFAECVLEVLHG